MLSGETALLAFSSTSVGLAFIAFLLEASRTIVLAAKQYKRWTIE